MTPVIGSLCSGYGGLDKGVQAVLGGRVAWCSDNNPGASKILAHRYAAAPNLGDFTVTDWATVEPVQILTAGFPCQPVSNAGKRLGDQDERWLWDDVARAVSALRPELLLLENVRGLFTAGRGRLFGRVLGALADIGYDAQWHGFRAADIDAAHNRFRVFIAATPRDADVARLEGWRAAGRADKRHPGQTSLGARLTPPPLLPTPAVNDMGEGKTPAAWDAWRAKMQAAHGNGNGHGKSLAIEAQRLLPTPKAVDGDHPGIVTIKPGQSMHLSAAVVNQWGQYTAAIARWEHALGRPAPAPTMTSTKGDPQLSPAFVEWLMGLPAGWVTEVPEITRTEALKALGNGVVPQQAAAALETLLTVVAA